MRSCHTFIEGDINIPTFVREAAERSLKVEITEVHHQDNKVNQLLPFGKGNASIIEVQKGFRCELLSLTCTQDNTFEFTGGPLFTCNLTLEGSVAKANIDGLGVVENPLHQTTIISLTEKTQWRRKLKSNHSFKSFGFTLEPVFFDRFSDVVEDEYITILDRFRAKPHAFTLPKNPQLIALAQQAFEHSYTGSLVELFHESNTLQFLLTLLKTLKDKTSLLDKIGKPHYERLMHARNILDKDLINPPKTFELAKQVGSNINTLQAHFKLAFGTTIFGYVKRRRLEIAKVLITDHKLGSAQAGYRVGFSNPAAFTAAYRKYFGHTPSKYS